MSFSRDMDDDRFSELGKVKAARNVINIIGFSQPEPDYTICCKQRTIPFGDSKDGIVICQACGRKYQKVKEESKPKKITQKYGGKREPLFVKSIDPRGKKKTTGGKPDDIKGEWADPATWSEDTDLSGQT